MKTQTKRIAGRLLDISNNNHLADVLANITLRDPQNEKDKPEFDVVIIVDEYKPELSDKSHILNLNDKIAGEVFITISGIPGKPTRYTCNLQDAKWNNLEWFQTL
jgi:hypothetical protein